MTERTPDDVLAEMRALKAVPDAVEGDVQDDALTVDGFADLDSFFDDRLVLPVRGHVYSIAPASAELGLLCTRLLMAGQQVAAKGRVTTGTRAQLDDDDETELYQRLLGHTPFLTDGSPAQPAVLDDDGMELAPAVDEVPPKPNPAYSSDDDVWEQLIQDGLDWQRIQHVGTTAMIWTAVGKAAAQQFWASGARPKVSAGPKAPQDRRAPAGTARSGQPGSTGGTTSRKRGGAAATAGT